MNHPYWIVKLVSSLLVFVTGTIQAELTVDSDFEGGSGMVSEIDPEKQIIRIEPTDHPGKGWRCWWYVKIEGFQSDSKLTVNVGNAPWATPDRAHFRFDDEKTWQHSATGIREGKQISYTIPTISRQKILYVAWGPPFVPSDAEKLVNAVSQQHENATAFELCKTREGRSTPALLISAPKSPDMKARDVIWIQARQHAWESGSSWVAKGAIDWLVSDDSKATKLRKRAEIIVVPIMDIDNVARGAGGKSQKPQDHNRDWSDKPHWNSVRAAQAQILEADQDGKLALFIDLHNPGANDRFPYFYTPPKESLSPLGGKNLGRFLADAKTEITGPLKFTGRAVESGAKYDPEAWTAISKNWVSHHTADHVVAVTLETSWNTPSSTAENYETVGRQLMIAVERYLRIDPRSK